MIKTEIIDDDNYDETIVEISSGKLRGTILTTDDNDNDNESIIIASYVGIPFADPPVGDLRWRPPNYPLSKDNIDKAWVTSSSSSNSNSNNNNKRNDEDNRNKMSMVRDCSTNQYRKMNIAHQSKKPDKYIFIEGLRNGMGFSFLKRILLYIILHFLLPYFLTPPESEDCLYLNVHVPKKKQNEKKKKMNDNDNDDNLLPVMVWFHGGAHHDGQGTTDPLVNKSHQLCTVGNVILVIVNYRLGLFGFFCHPELTKESSILDSNTTTTTTATSDMNSPSTCGNYGLLDQIASLKWVRDNIQAFGGNPNNITIFGESAGGEAVMYLLTSPFSKGLFHRAIAQSPSSSCQLLHRTQQTFCYSKSMQDCGIDFANYVLEIEKKLGKHNTTTAATSTTTIELLRKVPATKLMNLFRTDVKNFSFYPVIDGVVLPYSSFECFRQGKEHKNIPLMIGSNTDEGSLIWPLMKTPVRRRRVSDYNNNKNNNNSQNSSITERLIQEEFCNGNDAERLFKLYPGLRDGDSSAQSDCLGDSMFGSKAYYYAIHHANTNTMNNDTVFAAAAAAAINDTTTTTIGTHTTANATAACYLYQFGQHPPSPAQTADAYHLAELPYVFGGVGFTSLIFPVDTSTNLSEVMSKYWTNFATTGSPNNTNNNQDDDDDSPTTHTTSTTTTTTSNDPLPDWRACKPIATSIANGHKDEDNYNTNNKNNDNDNKNEWMYFGDGIAKMATLNDAKKETYDIMNRKLDHQLDSLPSSRKDK